MPVLIRAMDKITWVWEYMGCGVMWIAIFYLVVRQNPLDE